MAAYLPRPPVRALRLFGAARALLDAIQAPFSPADRAEWQRAEASTCGQLNEAACKQAKEEGKVLPLAKTVEYMLNENS